MSDSSITLLTAFQHLGMSGRATKKRVYESINDVGRRGDLVFILTEYFDPERYSRLNRWVRYLAGLDYLDSTEWHTAIYDGWEKERGSSLQRSMMVHASSVRREVVREHISPGNFSSHGESASLIQIVRLEGISADEGDTVAQYANGMLGAPFTMDGIRIEWLTYLFGMPNFLHRRGSVSCHGLAIDAYSQIGVQFPHALQNVPCYNIGRHLKRPLGHPRDHVNPRFPYLRDHHIYRDKRFKPVLAVSWDHDANDVVIVSNPEKYFWNKDLARAYGYGPEEGARR